MVISKNKLQISEKMDFVVKKSMEIAIIDNSPGRKDDETTIYVEGVDEAVVCSIKASEVGRKIYLELHFPQFCERSNYAYIYELTLEGYKLKMKHFKNIESATTKVLLSNSTIDELEEMCGHLNHEDNLYLRLDLTIKCERINLVDQLFQDISAPELTDFTFEIHNEKIPAHKFILSARSPVFRRMLSNDCYKETQQSMMSVTETTAEIFKLFLEFLYTANVTDRSTSTAIELIKLAEKYDVPSLKRICETNILKELNESDYLDIYMFAHQYNCSQEFIWNVFQFLEGKYFIGKDLPSNLCDNPDEVQRLVAKMEEFDSTLREVHEKLGRPSKKLKTT